MQRTLIRRVILALCSVTVLVSTPGTSWGHLDTVLTGETIRHGFHRDVFVVPDAERRWNAGNFSEFLEELDPATFSRTIDSVPTELERFWLIKTVRNETEQDDWMVYSSLPNMSQFTVVTTPKGEHEGSSAVVRRPYPVLGHALPVRIPVGESIQIGLLVEDSGVPRTNLSEIEILSHDHFVARAFRLTSTVLFALGIIVALGIYMLFIWSRVREETYLWYGLFAMATFLLWATHYKFFNLLFASPLNLSLLNLLSTAAMTLFCALFVRGFLNTEALAPWLGKSLSYFALAMVGLLGTIPLMSHELAYTANASAALVMLVLITIATTMSIRSGYKPARLFLLAWLILFSSGVLTILDALGMNFPTATVRLATISSTAAGMLIMAFSVANRIHELEHAREAAEARALTDALTGMRNRAGFDTDLARLAARFKRGELRDVVVIYADLDGLKDINDARGHHHGDQLLAQFGLMVQENFRDPDYLYRMGGDEFVLLLPDLTASDVSWLPGRFEKVVAQLRDKGFTSADVSVGVAFLSETSGDGVGALRLADRRMYDNKHGKKGRPEKAAAKAVDAASA